MIAVGYAGVCSFFILFFSLRTVWCIYSPIEPPGVSAEERGGGDAWRVADG